MGRLSLDDDDGKLWAVRLKPNVLGEIDPASIGRVGKDAERGAVLTNGENPGVGLVEARTIFAVSGDVRVPALGDLSVPSKWARRLARSVEVGIGWDADFRRVTKITREAEFWLDRPRVEDDGLAL